MREYIVFKHIVGGIYQIFDSKVIGYKTGAYVGEEQVITLLNSPDVSVDIVDKHHNDVWTND